MTATVVRVPDFLPSTSGLRFANAWPHVPDLAVRFAGRNILSIGDAANGLCGGMTFVAADRHIVVEEGKDGALAVETVVPGYSMRP